MTDSTKTLIKEVENATSATSLVQAVQALAKKQDPEAISTLIAVLGYNNPGAAVAAVNGLVQLGSIAVTPLLEKVDNYNYGARAWSVRVFAQIGDPRTLDLLVYSATNDFSQSVRRAAAKGLGNITWSLLPPEEILSSQEKALDALILALQDGEWVVRYASVVGLESLASAVRGENGDLKTKIIHKLTEFLDEETEILVIVRVKLALKTLC